MEIGVGSAISKSFGFISVARYSPKGGSGGPEAFRTNVFSKGIMIKGNETTLMISDFVCKISWLCSAAFDNITIN